MLLLVLLLLYRVLLIYMLLMEYLFCLSLLVIYATTMRTLLLLLILTEETILHGVASPMALFIAAPVMEGSGSGSMGFVPSPLSRRVLFLS